MNPVLTQNLAQEFGLALKWIRVQLLSISLPIIRKPTSQVSSLPKETWDVGLRMIRSASIWRNYNDCSVCLYVLSMRAHLYVKEVGDTTFGTN